MVDVEYWSCPSNWHKSIYLDSVHFWSFFTLWRPPISYILNIYLILLRKPIFLFLKLYFNYLIMNVRHTLCRKHNMHRILCNHINAPALVLGLNINNK